MMYTAEQVGKMVQAGGKLWQNYGKNRVYYSAWRLGLKLDGRTYTWDGVNCGGYQGRNLDRAKTYIDLDNGKVYSDESCLKERVEAILAKAIETEAV